MKTKIKIILIVMIAFLMGVGGLFLAINLKKETISYFADGGYLINSTYSANKVETNKEYFLEDASYQSHSDDKYSFKNTDGKNVIVSKENFVHYDNGSKIDYEILNYYNIFEGSILQKKDGIYQINNLNETITFNKLLFKISDSKYLLAADNIVISFSDGQTVSAENFIEIEYADKNVIRLYNDKVNYQTISSDLYILTDNIKIDVAYKTVSKNDVDCLAMVNMVINANDNIEVITPKEDEEDDSTENESNNNSGGSSGGGGSGGGSGYFGGTDTSIDDNTSSGNSNAGTGNNSSGNSSSNETIEIPNIIKPGNSGTQNEETIFTQPKFTVT